METKTHQKSHENPRKLAILGMRKNPAKTRENAGIFIPTRIHGFATKIRVFIGLVSQKFV